MTTKMIEATATIVANSEKNSRLYLLRPGSKKDVIVINISTVIIAYPNGICNNSGLIDLCRQ